MRWQRHIHSIVGIIGNHICLDCFVIQHYKGIPEIFTRNHDPPTRNRQGGIGGAWRGAPNTAHDTTHHGIGGHCQYVDVISL